MNHRLTLSLYLLAATLLFTACSKRETTALPETTEYVVGTEAAFAPFEYQNTQKEIVGFDIDVMQAIADKSGFRLKFINTPFEGIFNFLAQGDRDMLASAITITDERKQTVDFSAPYFEAKQLIVVPKNSAITQFSDLKNSKVGVQSATTGDEIVRKELGNNNPNIKRLESIMLIMKELESGGVEAVVADDGVVKYYIKNNPSDNFRLISDPAFPKEYYGFAVKKGNAVLLSKIDQGLAAIKADGSYEKIYAKYFDTNAGEKK